MCEFLSYQYLLICFFTARDVPVIVNPCVPSPCGPNSVCRAHDDRAVCTCVAGMLGTPPNCRPECLIHQDCPSNRACLQQKCQDPCVGSCGLYANCVAQNHQPVCFCEPGYEGDPYSGCSQRQGRCCMFSKLYLLLWATELVAPLFYECSMFDSNISIMSFISTRNTHRPLQS